MFFLCPIPDLSNHQLLILPPKMNAAVTNLAFMMGAMQVAKRIPFEENPEYVTYARIAYVGAQVVVLLINYFISMKVSLVCAVWVK